MSLSTNTTYRVFVEKLGGTDPANFVGDAGEVFLDPSVPELKLSDGTTAGGVTIGGGESYWVSTAAGIHTLSNVGIGTTNPTTKLQIDGVLGFGTFIASGETRTNIRIGDNTTGANITSGSANIFIGIGAGNSTTTGNHNNFFGQEAGAYNTTGSNNNFLGRYAGRSNTTGGSNNFFGVNAGYRNTSGLYNNFFGVYAGYLNTTGRNNNFLGSSAGFNNTTGNCNNFIGPFAGRYNTTGNGNNFLGEQAGYRNTTGSNNNFFGSYTGVSTTASNKIIFGRGFNGSNIFDAPDTTKDTQFAVGVRTDNNPSNYWIVGNENFNVGIGTTNPTTKLQIDGVLGFGTFIDFGQTRTNIRIGDNTTGANLTTGYDNIFMGIGAGNSTTSGYYNNFFGILAGRYNTTGQYNNFLGHYAGEYNTTGTDNNFFGDYAGRKNTTGSYNNFLGYNAGGENATGSYNNFFGQEAGLNNTGNYNNFFGYQAGYYNTTGSENNFMGSYAGYYNTAGSNNIFFGSYTGVSTTASNKIIFGYGFDTDNLFDSPDTDKDIQFAVGVRTDANPSKYWIVGNENFNVGIGTTNPTTKLQVGGDVKVGVNTSQGVILTDPNGVAWRLSVNTDGTLTTTAV